MLVVALAALGFLLIAFSYARFLALAHSPAGSLTFIEAAIALRKRLQSGEGGRGSIAAMGTGVLAAVIAGAVTLPRTGLLAAVCVTVMASMLHRFTLAVAAASHGRIGSARVNDLEAAASLARRVALIPATAAAGSGLALGAILVLSSKSFIGPEAAGAAAAAFALIFPAAAHVSARTSPGTLRQNVARRAGLLSAIVVSGASLSALLVLAPGCPFSRTPLLLVAGLAGSALLGALVFMSATRLVWPPSLEAESPNAP